MSDMELKPCPFCGGTAKVELFNRPMAVKMSARVVCEICGAKSESIDENVGYCAKEKAAEAWNRRVTKDEL